MIEVRNLQRIFHVGQRQVVALHRVNQEVREGEFLVLLGPSGSGKTTLLRCVAGLETPDDGEIFISGQTVFSKRDGIHVPPEDRQIGMVFQSYAIWPHMTVFENVALPLTYGRKRIQRHLVRERVLDALRLVQLDELAERPAPLLSGGQQQRVALARALAINPKLVLMDEPLSNLDARLREEMRDQIRDLARRLKMTVMYVTHDQVEAMVVADRIAVMSLGSIISFGSPEALYEGPTNRNVAEFFGSINWLEAEVVGRGVLQTNMGKLLWDEAGVSGQTGMVGLRPEDIELGGHAMGPDNRFAGSIVSRTFLGDLNVYEVRVGEVNLKVKTMQKGPLANPVEIRIPKERVKFFAS
ncbi:MAG: ABC transporter ATP-binding protein [Candidatus Binatia bacterium]